MRNPHPRGAVALGDRDRQRDNDIFSTIPAFADETPYTIVVATFDEGVRLTGQLRDADEIERGETVAVGAERRDVGGWLVTFAPTE